MVVPMPWRVSDSMKERAKFVLEWERRWKESEGRRTEMAELCRMFGISRPTGYKWVERFQQNNWDIRAVAEQSRKPKTSPTAIIPELEDSIVAARKAKPHWGPRKLRERLMECNPGVYVPSASLIAKVLKRRGLTTTRRRRRTTRPAGVVAPFSNCEAPNAVWCIDFKGHFETQDAVRCYPLTLLDAYSRYLLRCELLLEPDGRRVQKILDSAFLEFGLPLAMRSDGGPPFASSGAAKLTFLSVWLLRLGIRIEIIAPGKPQQNGRLERFHRTLKAETAAPPSADAATQQRCFDVWRGEYNNERPHEALKMRKPADVYERSRRRYPRPFVRTVGDPFGIVARVDKHGAIKWHRKDVLISSALSNEELSINTDGERYWQVHWGAIHLGQLDEHNPSRGLIVPRRPRGSAKITSMSLL